MNSIRFTLVFMFLFLACQKKISTWQTPESEKNSENQRNVLIPTEPHKNETALLPKIRMRVGAEQFELYLPEIQGKKVALVVNHSALVQGKHLVDVLLSKNVQIRKVFAPEHGFRGDADAGETIQNEKDTQTGLLIVSLYGKNKKPSSEQLKDVETVIFDIQDVGVRFFTYISTMHYVMEACAENDKEFIVLDRPNPNGDYVAGPVLQKGFESFIGMHPIPVVHGLTVGELAQMINGEKWLSGGKQCKLKVIAVENYTHQTPYELPVKPSPNLPNHFAIRLYPSLCFFEGTPMSVGRGTDFPFQVVGYPDKRMGDFTFTPVSKPGMAKNPLYENQLCYGIDYRQIYPQAPHFTLQPLIDCYHKFPEKDKFFNAFFDKLAGNSLLKEQIRKGMSEAEIATTWQKDLQKYLQIRKKYLLYE